MLQEDSDPEAGPQQEHMLVDGMLYNGVDAFADRRSHLRALTMARQAAERRAAAPRAVGSAAAQSSVEREERALTLQRALLRLQEEHRAWQREHGLHVAERIPRRRRSRGTLDVEAVPASAP